MIAAAMATMATVEAATTTVLVLPCLYRLKPYAASGKARAPREALREGAE